MTSNELPIACNLTEPQFQLRRAELLGTLREARMETRELEDGFVDREPRATNHF